MQRRVGSGWASGGRSPALGVATLPATLCLGATLPAIGEVLVTVERLGSRGGWLYAVNTFGGALGLIAAGFGLPAAIGVRASYAMVALASAIAGGAAFAVSRGDEAAEVARADAADHVGTSVPWFRAMRLHGVAFATGTLGIGLEVLWIRLFAQVLHNSVYSFSAVTLVFVVSAALGAGLAGMLGRRLGPLDLAAGALAVAGAATLAGFWIFLRATDGLAYVGMQAGLGEYVIRIVGLAAVTAGPAALAAGAVLPALWTVSSDRGARRTVARPLGEITAANTIGAIVGALAAGLVVMPTIGLRGGMLLAVVGYVVAAHAIAPPAWRFRPLLHVIVLVAVVADPARAALVNLYPGVESLRALYEGPAGVTSVVEVRGNLQLRMDNYYVLGGDEAASNERRLGLLPLLLHPDPAHVLFIGLATGITASAGPALGVKDTTVVEIVPEVARAAREHFGTWNDELLTRPDVHLVIDDGRRYLQAHDRRFDVVVSDLFIPWHAGTGSLYAREMYEIVARRLAPDGLFCQWLPLYQLTREEFDVIVETFLTVFPHAALWRDDFYPNRPVVGLVGRLDAEPVDLERVAERAAALPTWGQDSLLAAPRGLAMFYAGNLTTVADDFAAAPVNTDDRPVIEFLAPRLTRMSRTGDKDWFIGEPLAAFYDRLLARDPEIGAMLAPASESVDEARRAGLALFRYVLADASGDEVAAARFQDQVRASVPEIIATFGEGGALADVGSLRESLSALRTEQEAVRHRLEAMQRNLERLGARRD